jgi:hypothetical protein
MASYGKESGLLCPASLRRCDRAMSHLHAMRQPVLRSRASRGSMSYLLRRTTIPKSPRATVDYRCQARARAHARVNAGRRRTASHRLRGSRKPGLIRLQGAPVSPSAMLNARSTNSRTVCRLWTVLPTDSSAPHSRVQRSLAHTASHVGQIVFLSKHFCGPNWKTLSIPRGKSEEFTRTLGGQGLARR